MNLNWFFVKKKCIIKSINNLNKIKEISSKSLKFFGGAQWGHLHGVNLLSCYFQCILKYERIIEENIGLEKNKFVITYTLR